MKFTISIDSDNEGICNTEAVSQAIRKIAKQIEAIESSGEILLQIKSIKDINGNTVGSWSIEQEIELRHHNTLTFQDYADFTWDFGQNFLLKTDNGYFIWSDPAYGGDNTIRPYPGNSRDFGGKFKGNHEIGSYCGNEVQFLNEEYEP